jgi:hypothetical protein
MTRVQWPTPEQIGAYLCSHGWRFDRPMKQPGAVYVYHRLTDSGKPIELFVPYFVPNVDEVSDFATSVLAVAETVESFEGRDREAVLADMLAIDSAPTSRTPPVPAT